MLISDLIIELQKYESDADVRLPDGSIVDGVRSSPPQILTDNSNYPVVTLLSTNYLD